MLRFAFRIVKACANLSVGQLTAALRIRNLFGDRIIFAKQEVTAFICFDIIRCDLKGLLHCTCITVLTFYEYDSRSRIPILLILHAVLLVVFLFDIHDHFRLIVCS